MSMNTEAEKRYFEETARALQREGFRVEKLQDGHLNVLLNDEPLCEVSKVGGIAYRNVTTPERVAAKDTVLEIAITTAEYMRELGKAPPLPVSDLKDRYKVLADFNGTVLAGTYGKYGAEFVTWDWDFNHEGVSHGHFFGENYIGAKEDFAIRSGLILRHQIFGDGQLVEIYRCCADTLDAGFDLTCGQEECIKGIQQQIERGIPDIMDQIKEQDQHMEPPSQELTM